MAEVELFCPQMSITDDITTNWSDHIEQLDRFKSHSSLDNIILLALLLRCDLTTRVSFYPALLAVLVYTVPAGLPKHLGMQVRSLSALSPRVRAIALNVLAFQYV
jgi:hypothetical protein